MEENLADAHNQNEVLSKENSTLKEDLADAHNQLADAHNQKEVLTRSLNDANTIIDEFKCSPHPESLDGESWEDWENRRYDE